VRCLAGLGLEIEMAVRVTSGIALDI
jgi:hypothetical protein